MFAWQLLVSPTLQKHINININILTVELMNLIMQNSNEQRVSIRPSSDGTYYGMVMSVRVSPAVFRHFLIHALTYWVGNVWMTLLFSSPEPKARVNYCHSAPSVRPSVRRPSVRRKLFIFSTSSPEPLDGFWWNLVGIKYSWSLTSVVVFRPDPPRGGSRAGPK